MILLLLSSCFNHERKNDGIPRGISKHDTTFQSLAKKYGADEYGMKTYVMAFLKNGPDRNHDE